MQRRGFVDIVMKELGQVKGGRRRAEEVKNNEYGSEPCSSSAARGMQETALGGLGQRAE